MKDPFEAAEGKKLVKRVLSDMECTWNDLEDLRVWLHPMMEAGENEGACRCVFDQLFLLSSLLFSVQYTLGVHGSVIREHLENIQEHERKKEHRDSVRFAEIKDPELDQKIKDGTATIGEIMSAVPVGIGEDEGPGPNGVH